MQYNEQREVFASETFWPHPGLRFDTPGWSRGVTSGAEKIWKKNW